MLLIVGMPSKTGLYGLRINWERVTNECWETDWNTGLSGSRGYIRIVAWSAHVSTMRLISRCLSLRGRESKKDIRERVTYYVWGVCVSPASWSKIGCGATTFGTTLGLYRHECTKSFLALLAICSSREWITQNLPFLDRVNETEILQMKILQASWYFRRCFRLGRRSVGFFAIGDFIEIERQWP